MTPVQVSHLFRHTTNITQIVLVNSSHHPIHIHHGGPDRQRIEEVCGLPIRELAPPRAMLASNPSQSPPRPLNTAPNPALNAPSSLPTPAIITESVDSPAPNRRLPEAPSQDVVITATATEPPHEQQPLPNSSPTEQRPTLTHPLEVPSRNLLTSADTESTSPVPIQIARPEPEPIHFRGDRTQAPAPQPMESPPLAQSLRTTDLPQLRQIAPALASSGMNLEVSRPSEGQTNVQAQIAAQTARQDLERQTAEQDQQAQQTALHAEQERQQLAMEEERQRQAQEAAMRGEQERQQQKAALETESQRQAQETAMRAEQERQKQLAAMEAERQRQAQEAAMRAEQERQQQMASMEAERQRQAQEAAMRAEQERQQQMAAIEAERQRQAQEAAMRAEQERQQQALIEAERQRQMENRPSQE